MSGTCWRACTRTPRPSFGLARRLVPGVPQPAIVRRHLLLALREMEAVANGLLTTFQWRDAILDPVLEDLANHHQVARRDVRFLDDDNRLKVDTGYTQFRGGVRPGPLDTVGDQLVSVILREAGEAEALLLRIDPERATIVAYPAARLPGQGPDLPDEPLARHRRPGDQTPRRALLHPHG